MDKEQYWFCLMSGCGFGAYRLRQLLEYFGDVETIYHLTEEELHQVDFVRERDIASFLQMRGREKELLKQYDLLPQEQIYFCSTEHPDFPKRLRQIPDAPVGIFYKGRLPRDEQPSAAIIGARDCTGYGRELAYHFGKLLSAQGVQIISGMALGADAGAQWGAVDAGGKSFAVLGCGVDICYPRDNISLYMELQKAGGILSEYLPKTGCRPGFFPQRNRIISALADCLIVVEAREKSGTMITVDHALNQGKEVFAVPGRFGDVLSAGCNRLIKQGASLLMEDQELIDFFHLQKQEKLEQTLENELTETEKIVYHSLNAEPKHLEQILAETGLPFDTLLMTLLQMEFGKWIVQPMKNYYMLPF